MFCESILQGCWQCLNGYLLQCEALCFCVEAKDGSVRPEADTSFFMRISKDISYFRTHVYLYVCSTLSTFHIFKHSTYYKMFQTIRIDSDDVAKTTKVLKKYAKTHQGSKYLLSCEGATPEDGVKYHQQGWAFHHETAKAFSQNLSNKFPEFKGTSDKKSFAVMHKPPSYIPYIIRNDNKRCIDYDDLITNYTREEVAELQEKWQWIERRPHKLKGKDKKAPKFSDYVFERLCAEAVEGGIIKYEKVMTVFINYYQPTKVGTSKRKMKEVLDGYLWRLENRFPKNSKMHYDYYNSMCRMDEDDGLYRDNNENRYLKLEMYNKNAVSEEEDCCASPSSSSCSTPRISFEDI